MFPAFCGIDVCAFVEKYGCICKDSTFPKLVVSADNRISIFQDDVSTKTYSYDYICNGESQDVLEPLAKSVTKDVLEGVNRIMLVCKLSGNDVPHTIDTMTFSSFMLNAIYAAVKSEKNSDISFHVSCIEVNDKGINDLLQKSYSASNSNYSEVKVFELANRTGSDLIEKIITNTEDIDKIIETVFKKTIPNACLDCRHIIVFSIIVLKTRNVDGFEVMKTGRFILVDIEGCINFLQEVASSICNRRESCYLFQDVPSVKNDSKFRTCSLSGILKDFLSKSKVSILMSLPSTVLDSERIHGLEMVSEMQQIRLKPVLNEKLILRESLKDYANEIKASEKDLIVLKNNGGILISHQKYRSLKNRLLLSETQLKDFHEERKAFSKSVSNKRELLTRHQHKIKLTSIKIEEEMKTLNVLKVTLEETRQRKIDLNRKTMKEVDECVSMDNMTNSIMNDMRNQNSHLVKMKYTYEKSSSSARQLNLDVNNYTINAVADQNKLKDEVNSLLLYLKEVLLNSTILQNSFMLNTNEFHIKFEEMLKLWREHTTSLIDDFLSFREGISHNCFLLKNSFLSELVSLNFTNGDIIEVIKKNKIETLCAATSCSTKIHLSVENSIKSLYEVLCILEISQGKIKEQLKRLVSAICCHSNERMKFLSCTNSTMASMHTFFNVQLDLSSKINSNIFSHHQELKLSINQELVKVKEALKSLKKLFCIEQKFAPDKWWQRQTYVSNLKETGGITDSLQQCAKDHPILLGNLRKQCASSLDKLHYILGNQTETVECLGSQIFKSNEIECSIKDCSEGNKKKFSQQENDIGETIIKCTNTTRSVEDIKECATGGLQNIRNSFFNVLDFEKHNRANHICELRSYLNDYIKKCANIFELSEFTLLQLQETTLKHTENLESVEFCREEVLSSTPSSNHHRSKILMNEKIKFLKRLKKIATLQVNPGCQNNLRLDQESIINASILSLPSMSTITKVEIPPNRSLMHRKITK